MTRPYRMTTVAAAMAVLALGAACEEEKTPEEKAQQHLEKSTEEAGKATRQQAEETAESVSDPAQKAYKAAKQRVKETLDADNSDGPKDATETPPQKEN